MHKCWYYCVYSTKGLQKSVGKVIKLGVEQGMSQRVVTQNRIGKLTNHDKLQHNLLVHSDISLVGVHLFQNLHITFCAFPMIFKKCQRSRHPIFSFWFIHLFWNFPVTYLGF